MGARYVQARGVPRIKSLLPEYLPEGSLVDFIAEVLSIFPFVFALDFTAAVSILDLTASENLRGLS